MYHFKIQYAILGSVYQIETDLSTTFIEKTSDETKALYEMLKKELNDLVQQNFYTK